MDADSFRKCAKEMVDYVADYLENIRDRRPLSNVQPGYLKELIPGEAPEHPDKWEDVFNDIERVIMPGVTHWQSPNFHAYLTTACSYPAICADILSDGIACVGFNWRDVSMGTASGCQWATFFLRRIQNLKNLGQEASPACTELELSVLDWLGKLLQLPSEYLFASGKGGGVLQGSASEAALFALLVARYLKIKTLRQTKPDQFPDDASVHSKLVAYYSDEANLCIERACLFGAVRCHQIQSDNNNAMRGEALKMAIERDKKDGLIPFCCLATLGTTGSCAFDDLNEIGPLCVTEGVWLHCDAAYAGSAFICEEFRPLLNGVEFTDSFNFNPHKLLLVNFDCSALWFKNIEDAMNAYSVDPILMQHGHHGDVIDLKNMGFPLGRRFRSLKLWFVMRLYGVVGLKSHVRKHVALAKEFESLVRSDKRFEVTNEVVLGLVCFRLKGKNDVNKEFLAKINADGRIHIVPSQSKGVYYLRFAICATRTESTDIQFAWSVITDVASKLIGE